MVTMTYIPIPPTIPNICPSTVIEVDFVIVQEIALWYSVSPIWYFRTIEAIHKKKHKPNKNNIIDILGKVVNIYRKRDLTETQFNIDNKFECAQENLRPTYLNTVAASQHIGAIERSNRTIPDINRCHVQRLPYTYCPRKIIVGCIMYAIKLLNSLPAENGLSSNLSLTTLISSTPPLDYHHILKLNLDDFVQAHTTSILISNN